jgi:hypothetical protein
VGSQLWPPSSECHISEKYTNICSHCSTMLALYPSIPTFVIYPHCK